MHERGHRCMNCGISARTASASLTLFWGDVLVMTPRVRGNVAVPSRDRGQKRADTAAADRHGVALRCIKLDHLAVARALVTDDTRDIDDVAAVDADKPAVVEPRFDVADGERTEQLV